MFDAVVIGRPAPCPALPRAANVAAAQSCGPDVCIAVTGAQRPLLRPVVWPASPAAYGRHVAMPSPDRGARAERLWVRRSARTCVNFGAEAVRPLRVSLTAIVCSRTQPELVRCSGRGSFCFVLLMSCRGASGRATKYARCPKKLLLYQYVTWVLGEGF
jgi:hypothetical protein